MSFQEVSIMALQFLSHNWHVENFEEGIRVSLHQQELDSKAIWVLADELFELLQEGSSAVHPCCRPADLFLMESESSDADLPRHVNRNDLRSCRGNKGSCNTV